MLPRIGRAPSSSLLEIASRPLEMMWSMGEGPTRRRRGMTEDQAAAKLQAPFFRTKQNAKSDPRLPGLKATRPKATRPRRPGVGVIVTVLLAPSGRPERRAVAGMVSESCSGKEMS